MKLTKSQLKQIIKEELSGIMESREDHIKGIIAKIDRLREEIDRARNALEEMEADADMPGAREEEIYYNLMDIKTRPEYWETQQRLSPMEDKISFLLKQLQQLQQEVPGPMPHPGEEEDQWN